MFWQCSVRYCYAIAVRLVYFFSFRGCLVNHQIGADYPEFTPVDLTALRFRFARNGIATSKVEAGRQRKL